MKPACVKCQRYFSCKKNDFYFLEGMQDDGQWTPYKLRACDLYECPGCGAQILSGYAQLPTASHYQPDFAETVKRFGATLQINDC